MSKLPKYLYSVATGAISLVHKRSREAYEFMAKQDGFVSIYPAIGHTLFLYDSENNARVARIKASSKGIQCGNNICRFKSDGESIITFDDPNYKED
ncbi:MAG: hypothetical protein J6S85_00030 [Methanobrevibacter sp.]|nr:hypothetical protein [Methanobrevibacter sp.]